MVGCCGFLSFSLVFCRFGGRLETTLYIHFTRRWVKSRRHSSAYRENEDEKKGGKGTPFFAVGGFVGGGFVSRPVQLTTSASPTTGPAPSGGGRVRLDGGPPRLCARSLSRPPLRLAYAGREAEKPNASVATQILSRRLHQPVHKEEACGLGGGGRCPACGGCVKVDAGLYRWRWL